MNINYHNSELDNLSDPRYYTEPVNVHGHKHEDLMKYLKTMLEIRITEEYIADLISAGKARCPCHLGIGEEAIATGISANLRNSDRVFGAHRSHSHYLAMCHDIESLIAEVLGKATGCSKGMGGSMHLYSAENGFYGSVPIVAGTISIALGAALAAKMDDQDDIAVAYFGDGASEEGSLHESLNMAASYQLPILFVCENNLYSSHLDISQRQPSDRISRFADAHKISSRVIDGNDINEVVKVSHDLISSIRADKGPAFLETITYRWRGHVGPDENIDVGVRRKAEDIAAWKKRDPIARLYTSMKNEKILTDESYNELLEDVDRRVNSAVKDAMLAPYPESSSLLDYVYAQRGN